MQGDFECLLDDDGFKRVFNVQRNWSYLVERMSNGIRAQLLFDGSGALPRFHVMQEIDDRMLNVQGKNSSHFVQCFHTASLGRRRTEETERGLWRCGKEAVDR